MKNDTKPTDNQKADANRELLIRAKKAEAALKLAQQECIEQARINGAGAIREAALEAELEEAYTAIINLNNILEDLLSKSGL